MTDLLGLLLSTILVLLIELIESALEHLVDIFALYKCLCIIIIYKNHRVVCSVYLIANIVDHTKRKQIQSQFNWPKN